MTRIVKISLDKAELNALVTTYTSSQVGRALEYLSIKMCNMKPTKKAKSRFDSLPEELKDFMDEKIFTSKQNLTKWKKQNESRNNQD